MPCHREDESILECVNSHFEDSVGCRLPWRSENGSDEMRECSTADDFGAYQDRFRHFIHASEEDVYQETGCYYTCKYRVSEPPPQQ